MKQLKSLFFLSLVIVSFMFFSCTRVHDISAIARIKILNEEGMPFEFKDASRFVIYPEGKGFYSESGVFKDVNDLVYEQVFGNGEGIRMCTNVIELEKKLFDEILRECGIKIIDKNNEYKEKIHYLNRATYRECITKTYSYEIYDTVILEKK